MHSSSDFKSDFFSEFFFGFTMPVRSLKLIAFDPKLLILSILPVMITLLLFAILIYGIVAGAGAFLLAKLGVYFGAAVTGVLAILLCFLAFQGMIASVSFLSIPFNDFLAEQTERSIGVTPPARKGFGYTFRILSMDIGKTALNLTLMALFTIGAWVPVVGIISFLGLVFLNTLNFISYPQSRRLQGVIYSFAWVKNNGSRSLGFGIATLIIFSIPVINFFALPLSVVGGTILVLGNTQSTTVE